MLRNSYSFERTRNGTRIWLNEQKSASVVACAVGAMSWHSLLVPSSRHALKRFIKVMIINAGGLKNTVASSSTHTNLLRFFASCNEPI